MKYITIILSILFFLTGLTSLFWGLYILKLDSKSNINRAFLFLCISLSILTLGYTITNASSSLDSVLFWQRFSSIGWSFMYSINLHFLLLLTKGEKDKRQENLLFLLHIPAIISIYIFTLSNTTIFQYGLIKTNYGWSNIAPNTLGNIFYYFYYSAYTFIAITILLKWKQNLKYKEKIKNVNLIVRSMIVIFILGSFTDIISSSIFSRILPEVAPIFILIPGWGIFNLLKNCDSVDHEKISREELITNDDDKRKIFYSISMGYCIGGVLSLFIEYNKLANSNSDSFIAMILKNSMLFVVGISIYLVQNLKNKSLKDPLTITILIISIPMITLHFLKDASITVWVFPITIMIASLVFSNKTLLISTTIVSLITQRIVWILKPRTTVEISQYSYIFRMGIFLMSFIIALYVNRIYVAKLKENKYQMKFQKMNSDISSDFISINKENKDEKINKLLSKLGQFFQVDRTYLFLIDYDKNIMTYSHEWCNQGVKSDIEAIGEISLKKFPWWIEELHKKSILYIEDTNKIPIEAIAEKEQLKRQEIKSLISIAIEGNNNIQGFIGIDSVLSYRKWTDGNIDRLNILANVLSEGLSKLTSEKEIEFMAYYDNLTSLPNRFLFSDRVKQAICLAGRTEKLVSIMFIDLDNFKSINDTIGHSGGDKLLKEISKALSKKTRKSDTVARFGGDEFMIMINNINNHKDILKIADKVMKIFEKAFIIDEQEFLITASLGIATYPIDGEDAETLIKNADIAMYEAKSKGKNQYSLCTEDMKDEVQKNMRISNDLYSALQKEEFIVYYQPQIDLLNKEIAGFEALLRWNHPEFGMIPPSVFIPLAEKNGLINKIGDWVLREACTQNRTWQDIELGEFCIAVNLSAVQLINPRISQNIEDVLKETGLNPQYLEIEITESIAIKERRFVVDVLNKLKKIGVSIAIDDFGTEYSSLSRLKYLPIDRIKIDMSFIHGIENDKKDQLITSVIINLAKKLEMNVLAEGVENLAQLEFLNSKMCDYVQGYYYYKPMPAEEIEKILKAIKNQDIDLLEWDIS